MEDGSGGGMAVERGRRAWARPWVRAFNVSLFVLQTGAKGAGTDLFPNWQIGEKFKNNPAGGLALALSALAFGLGFGPEGICKLVCWGFFASSWESLPRSLAAGAAGYARFMPDGRQLGAEK